MKVLGLAGSPRRGSNTEILLDVFLDEAAGMGHETTKIKLGPGGTGYIKPCLACDECLSGKCVQTDPMAELYRMFIEVDALVLAAPIYFYGLPSHVKSVIDRCQLFFNQKYRKRSPLRTKSGKGFFISCGATRGEKLFSGAVLTVRYWFDSVGLDYAGEALFSGIDEASAIVSFPEAFEDVRRLAHRLGSCGSNAQPPII